MLRILQSCRKFVFTVQTKLCCSVHNTNFNEQVRKLPHAVFRMWLICFALWFSIVCLSLSVEILNYLIVVFVVVFIWLTVCVTSIVHCISYCCLKYCLWQFHMFCASCLYFDLCCLWLCIAICCCYCFIVCFIVCCVVTVPPFCYCILSVFTGWMCDILCFSVHLQDWCEGHFGLIRYANFVVTYNCQKEQGDKQISMVVKHNNYKIRFNQWSNKRCTVKMKTIQTTEKQQTSRGPGWKWDRATGNGKKSTRKTQRWR